jgi:hypothetical protein
MCWRVLRGYLGVLEGRVMPKEHERSMRAARRTHADVCATRGREEIIRQAKHGGCMQDKRPWRKGEALGVRMLGRGHEERPWRGRGAAGLRVGL